ncbi:secreted RxLR effector protein 161-like [Amaranthus tricolor]|uniref:secreted RxLR effector protein 161-like n=1 Tax=Amaranthus tricolor TaxID=29722 RepID=UPI00258982F5|nr:secreted RxLR effector protein 161-like [Amaranthus tricolor]
MLKKFNQINCKPLATPMALNEKLSKYDGEVKIGTSLYRSLVGSLIYLTNTRPGIVYALSIVSRFMSEPSKAHYAVAKRILRNIKGTKRYRLLYDTEKVNNLIGYSDSNRVGCIDNRKITSGYVFLLDTKAISWSLKKQAIVALSSAEAEYIAAKNALCKVVWLKKILVDLKHKQKEPTTIFYDMSTIAMTKNLVFHGRTKHIEIRRRYIQGLVNKKRLSYNSTGRENNTQASSQNP